VNHSMTTTAFTLDGYRIEQTKGIVRGIVVRSPSIIGPPRGPYEIVPALGAMELVEGEDLSPHIAGGRSRSLKRCRGWSIARATCAAAAVCAPPARRSCASSD
jgi:hypothetical protein